MADKVCKLFKLTSKNSLFDIIFAVKLLRAVLFSVCLLLLCQSIVECQKGEEEGIS